jgi:phospholipase/carboxylesterase
METRKLGALEAVVVLPRGEAVRAVVILMHGFGAPGEDLVGLAEMIDAPRGTAFVFPKAPHTFRELYGAPPFVDARAWWKLDLEAIERARRTGGVRDLSRERPEGIDAARALVVGLLAAVREGFPGARVVLGGFSQGAMLACDTALREGPELAGLVVLSGTLVAEAEWTALFPTLRGTPVFQSHGTVDDILPFALAERLRDGLERAEVKVTWVRFDGGHGLSDEVVTGLGRFLAECL